MKSILVTNFVKVTLPLTLTLTLLPQLTPHPRTYPT